MKLKLYYSVQNGGDGSAHPKLMESMELARFDQQHMLDSWGEDCVGTITLKSDTTIQCLDEIITKEQYFIEKYCDDVDDNYEDREEFISTFFPNGLPTFLVKVEKIKTNADAVVNINSGKYRYNNVFVGKNHVARVFRNATESGKVYEDFLNSQNK